MRTRSASRSPGAPPAGTDGATPRRDLRGFRLAPIALIERVENGLRARRLPGFVGGFVAGFIVGVVLLLVGVPDVAAVLAAAITHFVVAIWLPFVLLEPADRKLLGIVNRMAVAAALAWRRAFGRAAIPRTEEQQLLWIAAQPDTTIDPEALEIEASTLLILGRYEAARERAERIPADTPWRRFDRAVTLAAIEFDAGGPGDLAEARNAAETMTGPRRPLAIVELAFEEAAQALVRGDDWGPPITRAADAAGRSLVADISTGLGRAMAFLPWLLVSELALGAVLYLVATRAVV